MPASRILIVDDEAGIVRLCQRVLERAGYSAFPFTDPNEALEFIRQQPVDLLLTDIRMPSMDGFELANQCRAVAPDVVVLMMTGYGTMEMAIHALQRGIDGLLLKPFESLNDLVAAVEQVLLDASHRRDAQRLQTLRPLFEVSETLLAETDSARLSELIHSSLRTIIQSSQNGFWIVKDDGRSIVGSWEAGEETIPADACQETFFFHKLKLEEGTIVVSPAGLEEASAIALMESLGWREVAVTYLRRPERDYLLYAARMTDEAQFNEIEIETFRILSGQSIIALENAQLYDELRTNIRKLEESQAALVQAEKMAAVGRLTASVAHEVNNPLQSIRNCIHLAGLDAVDANQRREYLDLAQGELDRLARIVQGMLEFARPGKEKMERVDLVWLVKRTLDLLGPQLRDKQIRTVMEAATEDVAVVCVKEQIQQVLFNVLLNAIDAVQAAEEKILWIAIRSIDGQALVLIEDSGAGISEGAEARIFEPFVSTKPEGTGLGLTVSYGIMQAHHGQLRVIPGTHGKGACFELAFGGIR